MTSFNEIHLKKAEIELLGQKFGAENIRVFGSVARGDETAESDIDFLVSMQEGRSYFDLIRFQSGLKDMLHKKIDVLSDGGLSPFIERQILDEARPI